MECWCLCILHGLHVFTILASFLHRIFVVTVQDSKLAIYKLSALILAYAVFVCIHEGWILSVTLLFLYPMLWIRILFDIRVSWVKQSKKAVFITGCDSGFGNSLAHHLARRGVKVFAGCLLKGQLGESQFGSISSEAKLLTLQLDVTDQQQIDKAEQFVKDNLDQDEVLWAVVNNAGVNYIAELELADMNDIDRMMNINCMGQIRVTKTFLPLLRAAKGHVVNVASLAGNIPLYNLGGYCMSKFAVEAFSGVLRQEMMKWGVSVSVIEPGPYATSIGNAIGEMSYVKKLWEKSTPNVQEAYGWPYLEAYLKTDDFAMERDITPVIEAMEDAVFSCKPKWVYKMGSGSHYIHLFYTLCPPLITPLCEALLKHFTLYPGAVPKALK